MTQAELVHLTSVKTVSAGELFYQLGRPFSPATRSRPRKLATAGYNRLVPQSRATSQQTTYPFDVYTNQSQ
jgi:hypothetical protein